MFGNLVELGVRVEEKKEHKTPGCLVSEAGQNSLFLALYLTNEIVPFQVAVGNCDQHLVFNKIVEMIVQIAA